MGGCKSWQPWFRERVEREVDMARATAAWMLALDVEAIRIAPGEVHAPGYRQSSKYWPV